ncbi:MAG: hypothetical protein KJ880_07325, partial [Candidatus Omnitrophica bacterium]|nr:hypothetical protein [Candidatus Omnitrophota bacterium]
GINYALDKLRRQDDAVNWPVPAPGSASYTRRLCRNCTAPNIPEPSLPRTILYVDIKVSPNGTDGCNPPAGVPVCVRATADYTFTP